MRNLLLVLSILAFSGCASYNQKAFCLQIGTTNAALPYVGGATSGSGYACYISCVGPKCPQPQETTIIDLTKAEISQVSNSIITSGPVKITATPLK